MSNDGGKSYKKYKHGTLNSVTSDTDTFVYDNPNEVDPLDRLRKLISGQEQQNQNDVQTWTGYVLKVLPNAGNEDFSKHQKAKLRVPGQGEKEIKQFIVRIPELHAAIPEPQTLSFDEGIPSYDELYVELHDVFTMMDSKQPPPAPGDLVECDFRNRKDFTEGIIIDVYHEQGSFTGGLLKAAGDVIDGAKDAYGEASKYLTTASNTASSWYDTAKGYWFGEDEDTDEKTRILNAVKRSLVPTANRISSMPQKNRKDPVKGKKSKNHDGLDVAVNAKRNQPVIAPKGGVVEKSILETQERGPWNGNYVVIKHDDGYRSYFLHLQEPSKLKKGDVVEKGDLVGIVGNSGRSAGIHLHYAIKKGRQWQIPQDILLDEWKV